MDCTRPSSNRRARSLDQLTLRPEGRSGVAEACATDPSMTSLLLDTLADLGVVHREGPVGIHLGAGRAGADDDGLAYPLMRRSSPTSFAAASR